MKLTMSRPRGHKIPKVSEVQSPTMMVNSVSLTQMLNKVASQCVASAYGLEDLSPSPQMEERTNVSDLVDYNFDPSVMAEQYKAEGKQTPAVQL